MTCWRRVRDWQQAGVWDLIHFALLDWLARSDQIDWSRAVVDSCSIRAVYGGDQTGPNPTDRAKRGSKRHLIFDGRGVPLAVRLTGANRNDSQEALALVDAIPPLHGERGRPRQRPDCVLGDRGYDVTAIRRGLRARHRAVARHASHRALEWIGPVAVGHGADVCLAQSVSPSARAV
jgi:transposase